MTPRAEHIAEALDRFGFHKQASFASIVPAVAMPAMGAFLGKRYGGDVGALVGTIGGGIGGRAISETMDHTGPWQQQQLPQMMMDPSMQDIPSWARAGAQMLQPTLKMSAHEESIRDMLLGEIPGYAPVQGYREGGVGGALKGTGGQIAGGLGGGALGYGAGKLLSSALGRDVNIPLLNMPLSHALAGLGGTLGATKGFQAVMGR